MNATQQHATGPGTETSFIEEVRLSAFKSFRDAVLPLGDLTLLVGRNGSGKSNALDGLWVLSRLAGGGDIRDALDGGREGPGVRGGAEGCAPIGTTSFSLGCTVRTGDATVDLDVTVQTSPVPQVTSEVLTIDGTTVLQPADPGSSVADARAHWLDGDQWRPVAFRASSLLTTQVLARIPATPAGQRLHAAAAQVTSALRQVFVLDPVPHLMRQYVRAGDTELRRNADNLSAAVAELIRHEGSRHRIVEALNLLNEHAVVDVDTATTQLGDVMLTVLERTGDRIEQLPIRLASDGTLRFLAVLTALLQAPALDATPDPLIADDAVGQTTMVIEELENGLHASQARTVVDLIRAEVSRRSIRTLATVHSPTILDALDGSEHADVIVCARDANGVSALTRLVDLPDYFRVAAGGGLGKAATRDQLRDAGAKVATSTFIDELLGGAT